MPRMSKMLSRLVQTLMATLCLGALGCSEVEFADSTSQQNPLDAFESELAVSFNTMRSDAGLTTLKVCATLNTSASLHSDDMRDNGYLSDKGLDSSTTPSRACAAGFTAACDGKLAMAELLAKGNAEGKPTLDQWAADATTKPVLMDPQFVVLGIGRALGGESAVWTMDLASVTDPSCDAATP
jgi:uncharacterized protein YkwD